MRSAGPLFDSRSRAPCSHDRSLWTVPPLWTSRAWRGTRARGVRACGLPTAAWSAASLCPSSQVRGAPHCPQALPLGFFSGGEQIHGADGGGERRCARAPRCAFWIFSEIKILVVGPVGAVERGAPRPSGATPPRSKRLRATAARPLAFCTNARAVVLSRVSVHRPGRASRALAISCPRLVGNSPGCNLCRNQTGGPARIARRET